MLRCNITGQKVTKNNFSILHFNQNVNGIYNGMLHQTFHRIILLVRVHTHSGISLSLPDAPLQHRLSEPEGKDKDVLVVPMEDRFWIRPNYRDGIPMIMVIALGMGDHATLCSSKRYHSILLTQPPS